MMARSSRDNLKKRQRRVSDIDEIVLSLNAKGLTTGEISAHFGQIYGASVSKDTVSRITDRITEEMQAWSSRPHIQRELSASEAHRHNGFRPQRRPWSA